MKRFGIVLLLLFTTLLMTSPLVAQRRTKPPVKDTVTGEVFIRIVDQSLSLYYDDFSKGVNYDSIVDALDYAGDSARNIVNSSLIFVKLRPLIR